MNCTKKELFFFIAYFLLGLADIVIANSYLFGVDRLEIYVKVLYIAAIFSAISFCIGKYKIKRLILCGLIAFVGLLITMQMHRISFGVSVLLMVTAINIEPKKIIKICVINNIFFAGIVVVPSLLGLIQNDIYGHLGKVANCFGFIYYSNLPNILLSITFFTYLLADSRAKKIAVLILSLPIQLVVYKYCTVRLVFYLYLLFLFICLMELFYDIRKKHNGIILLSTYMFPLASMVTLTISLIYDKVNVLRKLNELVNYRFGFNLIGLHRYGINLFGNLIETDPGTIDANGINHYFFIDSGYIYSLLGYGLIFSVFLVVIYSFISRNAAKNKQSKMTVICLIICVYSVINNLLFSITLNPIPILAFQLLCNSDRTNALPIYRNTAVMIDRRV